MPPTDLLDPILTKLSGVSEKTDRNGDHTALCPFHNDREHPNLSVGPKGFICFSCGAKGGLAKLAGHLGIVVQSQRWDLTQAFDELRRRGLRPETAQHFKIEPDIEKQAWRYPVTVKGPRFKHFHRGEGGASKYWHAKGTPDQLYHGDKIKHEMWLVNGEPSVWVCWQAGIPAVCNIYGEGKFTPALANELLAQGCEIAHVVYDNDQAGRDGAWKVASLLEGVGIIADVREVPLDMQHADVADLYVKIGNDDEFRDTMQSLPFGNKPTTLSQGQIEKQPRYELRHDGIWYVEPRTKYSRNGAQVVDTIERQVCNFNMAIASEIATHDGDGITTLYDLAGTTPDRNFTFTVTGDEFSDERKLRAKILTYAGGKAIVMRGGSGHLVPAVQSLSNGYRREMFYTATGWYKIGDDWLFLTPGAELARMDVPHEVKRYSVVRDPGRLSDGFIALNAMLDAFPHETTYIAVAHAFLAPLFRWLNSTRYMLHLVGETGALKTSFACLLQSLYGDFADGEAKEGWRSTVNKLEQVGWHAKDVLFLIDDFKPRYVKMSDFTQLVHNYADNRARGRLRRDASIAQSKPMRCLLISTGEDMPEGEASVMVRLIVLRMRRSDGLNEKLQQAQDGAKALPAVMAEFIHTLPDELDVDRVNDWRNEYIKMFTGKTVNPGRIALNMAQNRLGWMLLGDFMVKYSAWSEDERAARDAEYMAISRTTLDSMAGQVSDEKASSVFLTALRAMLDAGEAVVMPRDGAEEPPLNKVMVGWQDGDGYYLQGSVAHHAVERWLRQAGRQLGFSEHAIWQQLEEDGVIVAKGADGKSGKVMRMRGQPKRVIHLKTEAFDAIEEVVQANEIDYDDPPF